MAKVRKKEFSYFQKTTGAAKYSSALHLLFPLVCLGIALGMFFYVFPRRSNYPSGSMRSGHVTKQNFANLNRVSLFFDKDLKFISGGHQTNLRPLYRESLGMRAIRSLPRMFRRDGPVSPLGLLSVNNPWSMLNRMPVLGLEADANSLYTNLLQQLLAESEVQPQEAKLTITNGLVSDFQADQAGRSLDPAATIKRAVTATLRNATNTEPVIATLAPNKTLRETNALGIVGLVAHGESNFAGSTKNRMHNIQVGASKFKWILLKPGQEFSFNEYLGPVSEDAGFKPELVIKTSGTVPELGGGLCQVSTTAFRAALYGGLPVTARRNHSYAVKYYAPQGTDATIYPGVQDLKFINDTHAYLLVDTYIEGTKLYFNFYGTPDDRRVEIDGPYQYDYGPGGAMKTRLNRVVYFGSASTTQTFLSKYVSKDLYPVQYEFPVTPIPPVEPVEPVSTPPSIQ
jgi:vancomycin resistance protein YoaR